MTLEKNLVNKNGYMNKVEGSSQHQLFIAKLAALS